ncbi:MAG TPA: glycoside hydrolase family 2 protein [Anaerolineaceae bacterium]
MQSQTLNGDWQIRQVDTRDWLPACVPGSVHTDLMAAGKLADPFVGTNENNAQWVGKRSWEYRRFFYPLPTLFRQDKIWLICDGLDTLAEVRLNGKILGQTDNMYRTWQWDIKSLLLEGENKLEILFRSPVGYMSARERRKPTRDMAMGIRGAPHLRKTPSHFGWDWGPRLACVGIWKDIRLEGQSRGRLGDIRFEQVHTPGLVMLTARVQCEIWEQVELRHTLRLRITGPDRQVWLQDAPARPQSAISVMLPNPQLWWPNGSGGQPLYKVEVELLDEQEQQPIDTREYNLGLRTIALRQEEDSFGRSFTLVVNGLPIFCKGSNWIPPDSFPARVTPEHLETLVAAAVETHQNMLRVWGGGPYENDAFYDLCDTYGILVWQDFPFACATYPLDDPAYLENVRGEVIDNVHRLRHHASLALWCGSNEIEWLGSRLGWFSPQLARETFQRFFYQDLPGWLATEDPGRAYWPGSPSASEPFNDPNSDKTGDAHLWNVFHEFKPAVFYRQQNPRFVSEFGFQGLPALSTVAQFAPEGIQDLNSRIMRHHQRAFGGNSRLIWYMAQRFRLPKRFDDLVYLSQVMQAEVVRTGVEHWRRHPERTSGTLYWQLNDCWPAISWASIDYYGRWKALHYAARRFYSPVLLSVEDQTEKNQRKMAVWVSNDSRDAWTGMVHWSLETLDGDVIEGGDQPVTSAAQSSQCVLKQDFAHQNGKVDWKRVILVAELWQGAARQALQVTPFVPEKEMPLQNAGVKTEIQETGELLQVRVSSSHLARFVEISLAGANAQFSDNFFDLPAGRVVTVECELPYGWTVEQARAALKVRSLDAINPSDSLASSHWKGDLALIDCLLAMVRDGLIKPLFR